MEGLTLMLPYRAGCPGEAKGCRGASLLKLMKSGSRDELGSSRGTIQKCLPLTDHSSRPPLPQPLWGPASARS